MNPRLAVDNQSDLLLDSKAVIGAVRHQLAAWESVREADLGENTFADLRNDIAYLEIIPHRLDHTFEERYGVAP